MREEDSDASAGGDIIAVEVITLQNAKIEESCSEIQLLFYSDGQQDI